MKAFKVNSIDYLLKPIDDGELRQALAKYEKMRQSAVPAVSSLSTLLNRLESNGHYKDRFLIKHRDQYTFLLSDEIAYFYSEDSLTFIITKSGKSMVYDQTLNQLESDLDPRRFFRVNRRQIVGIQSIQKIHSYFNNRIKLDLQPGSKEDVIVSREKVRAFKDWLGG